MSTAWIEKLAAGHIVLIDGGTGSELRRRGAPISAAAWSAPATETHGELLEGVHADYIRAGADVITTNTFASARFVLEAAGVGDRFEAINARAVEAALRARDRAGRDLAVAGSISCLPPRFDTSAYPDLAAEEAAYRELATLLARCGVDLIVLEMMQETRHAPLACAAAADTGLPVWLGVSCRRAERGSGLVAYDLPAVRFADVLDALLPYEPAVVNVMHTPPDDVGAALAEIARHWSGPTGAYPELLRCADATGGAALTPAELSARAGDWIGAGVQVLGGCCGARPAHIRALRSLLRSL
jgi:S-methylmethionine-dependent homocysteine/selenocysteine methylase